jgi:hypothetical protein
MWEAARLADTSSSCAVIHKNLCLAVYNDRGHFRMVRIMYLYVFRERLSDRKGFEGQWRLYYKTAFILGKNLAFCYLSRDYPNPASL